MKKSAGVQVVHSTFLNRPLIKAIDKVLDEENQKIKADREAKANHLNKPQRDHQAKMTDKQVIEARKLFRRSEWPVHKLAEKFGVTDSYMNSICYMKIRTHLYPLLPKYRDW